MKVFIVLCAVAVSCASAGHLGGYGAAPGAYANTGTSSQFRSEDNYGNYQFGYDEAHATGSSGRREERSGDVVRGSYRLGDADGRQRTVNYVADAAGFRATVHTNEPGVDSARDPADVLMNKEGHAVAVAAAPLPAPVYDAPAPVLAAPLPAAPIFRAPVVHAARSYAAPAPIVHAAAPAYEAAPVLEAPAPRAFSYSFGASHPSLAYAAPVAAPIAAPIAAPAPIYQHGLKY